MKSMFIAAVFTTLVAAAPPSPIDSTQPDANLALATSNNDPCYKQSRNHCLKVWSILLTSPAAAPFVIMHCRNKAKRECGIEDGDSDDEDDKDDKDDKDAALNFASMVEVDGSESITEVDIEKLKEALDMEMVD